MDNIRKETFLGSDKIIVGSKYTDLVLETLGKVYIKTGNNSRVLSDVLSLLDKTPESKIESQTIIVESLLEMEQMEYPGDGFFIYNKLTTTLYISYDERYIALIEAAEGAKDGYVRRRGDTMTGQLEINTVGPPLIIASSKLVNNLNAELVGGYTADSLAKKRIDEYITGNWTFKGKGVSESNWIFKDNVRMYGDLVTSRSLTSPEFASGFGGYGWRLDADTNTLTIDYLIVRKAMKVYEMVINKISATNGSVWISNSSKCDSAVQPTILTDSQLKSIPSWTGSDTNIETALKIIKSNTFYLPIPSNGANTDSTVTLSSELSGPSEINKTSKTFVNYKFIIYVKDAVKLVNNSLFKGLQTLYDESLLTSSSKDAASTEFLSYIHLYYINKEMVVTKWGGNEGQWDEGTEPIEWEYRYTFDKKFPMFIIPKGIEPTSGRLYSDLYEQSKSQSEARNYVFPTYPYYKYFALEQSLVNTAIQESDTSFNNGYVPSVTVPNLWIVNTDDNEYPLFKAGDIIRCQKYADGDIKYYDAIVLTQIESRQFIVQKAVSVFDKYTEISYNEDGSVKEYKEEYNSTQYNKTEKSYSSVTGLTEKNSSSKTTEARVDDIASGDDMIQMGNIYDVQRQNAIYLTSCDDDGPFIDVISGLNRPDYSVLYDLPVYRRQEFIYRTNNSTFRYNGIKYNYYIQETNPNDSESSVYPINIDGKSYYGTLYPTKDSLLVIKDGKFKHAFTKTTRVRVGNLDGIYNEIFGKKQPYGFGLYGENVFLTGEFYLNNGTSIIDFSEDSILLKFKNAGLEIRDVNPIVQVPALNLDGTPILDENGNPTYRNKTEIYMNADQFIFSITGNPAMKLSGLFNDKTGQFQEALLDVQGAIQSRELNVGHEVNGKFEVFFKVSKGGNIWAQDCEFKNVECIDINAVSGKIGGFSIIGDNLIAEGIGKTTYMNLSPTEIYFRGVGSEYERRVAIGTVGSGVLPASSGLSMPFGIYSSSTDILSQNVGIYINCTGNTRYADMPLSGNIALYIAEGFIKGFRLNTRYIEGPGSMDDMDCVVFVHGDKDAKTVNVNLPTNPKDGHVCICMKSGSYNTLSVSDPNGRMWADSNAPRSSVKCNYNGFVIAVYSASTIYDNKRGMWFTGVVNKV